MSKLEGLNSRDRVRITFEGEVTNVDGDSLSIAIDGGDSRWFSRQTFSAETFSVERIYLLLKTGDRVRVRNGQRIGCVRAVSANEAWVWWEDIDTHLTEYANNLELVA